MVSYGTICTWMQRSGLMNLDPWPHRLHTLYTSLQISIFLLHVLTHFYSTLTRAVRYQPELIQMLLEDAINFFIVYSVFVFRVNTAELRYLVVYMDIVFSRAYSEINEMSAKKSRKLLLLFVSLTALAILGCFVETTLPLVPSELAVRRQIYRTKHTERRLPFSVRIPFIDESESFAYEVLYGIMIYIAMIYVIWITFMVCLAQVMLIYLRGQYVILSRFVALIGRDHRDKLGNRIFYTSIEKNKYVIKMYGEAASHSNKKAQWRMERQYERYFLRQIFVYHQKLLLIQEKIVTFYNPLFCGVVVANNVIISLSLFQLIVVSPSKITPLRYFKFAAELLAAIFEFFIPCNCSDITADCHELLRTAFDSSRWRSSTRETRRDLIMLLRRTTRENYMKFFNGAILLNRPFIMNVLRTAYTFVNFMMQMKK